jgi:hypothetical protein
VKSSLEPLLDSIPAYTSSDPILYRNLSIAIPPPTSVLLVFASFSHLPIGSLSFPTDKDRLNRFVNLHRFPPLVQLVSGKYQEIMKGDSRAIVVLGALHKGDEGAKEREKLEAVARAWKRGGRSFEQPVWFVWVEGDRWSGWLRQSYGIKKKDLPAVVVVDPAVCLQVSSLLSLVLILRQNSEYYDMTIEGNHIALDGNSIFSVLEGFYQHFLNPKKSETALEWGSRSATMALIDISVSHSAPCGSCGANVDARISNWQWTTRYGLW